MLRGGRGLTTAEHDALVREAERIDGLGGAWEPSAGNLAEVVLAVKAAGFDEHAAAQKAGITKAKATGTRFGRPRKEPPDNFGEYVRMIDEREIGKPVVCSLLDVGRSTLDKWIARYRESDPPDPDGRLTKRPKDPPDNFEGFVWLIDSRKLSRDVASSLLGVSRRTLDKWISEFRKREHERGMACEDALDMRSRP